MDYNKLAVGDRLRQKRTLIGLTQDEMADKIGRSPKYYADIERGSCGMSVETLLGISKTLDMSLDYIILGKVRNDEEVYNNTEEVNAILSVINTAPKKKRQYVLRMLKLFLASWDVE